MMKTVKTGDTVLWRNGWGHDPEVEAVVESMEVTEYPRTKYGETREEVTEQEIKENRVLFVLENGHWAYASQIRIKD